MGIHAGRSHDHHAGCRQTPTNTSQVGTLAFPDANALPEPDPGIDQGAMSSHRTRESECEKPHGHHANTTRSGTDDI